MPQTCVAVLTDETGAHLDAYLAGLAATDEVSTVVVADPSGQCRAAAVKHLGPKLSQFSDDAALVLKTHEPLLALVTVEAARAPKLIELVLESNCHLLAEKPSCVRIEDFERLARFADIKHRNLSLAFANRLRATCRAARQLIADGKIGKIYGCELHLVADQTRLKNPVYHQSWFADRARSGGGHLIWLGIHWIDLVMFLSNSRITDVTGFTGLVGGQPLKIEDTAAVALRFENGSFGTLTSGYYLDRGYHSHLMIWGSHGWVQMDAHGGEPLQWYSTKDAAPEIQKYSGVPDDDTYTPLVRETVQACLHHTAPPVTTVDSLHALKTVFACYQSATSRMVESIQ